MNINFLSLWILFSGKLTDRTIAQLTQTQLELEQLATILRNFNLMSPSGGLQMNMG